MTWSTEMIQDVSAQLDLMYNHVIRVGTPQNIPLHVPLEPGEELRLGIGYVERSGFSCVISEEFPQDDRRRHYGFAFRGTNGVSYRPDGRTSIDGSSGHNDLVGRIIDPSS